MIIKEISKVSEELMQEIRQLEAICKKHDNLRQDIFLDSSLNFNRDIKSLFLLYEDNKLISVLFMFIPTSDEAEISGFTRPEYRKNGYFNSLLDRAVNELKKYNVPDILFTCEAQSSDGKAAIKRLNADYDFAEYTLRYNKPHAEYSNKYLNKVELHKANREDTKTLVNISQQIFHDSYENAESMVMKAFECQFRQLYIVVLDGEAIGKGGISFEDEGAYIFGFGIVPKYQGKGFGKASLQLMLKEVAEQNIDKIVIEVDSKNESAFNLYKKCGFEVQTSYEYYRRRV